MPETQCLRKRAQGQTGRGIEAPTAYRVAAWRNGYLVCLISRRHRVRFPEPLKISGARKELLRLIIAWSLVRIQPSPNGDVAQQVEHETFSFQFSPVQIWRASTELLRLGSRYIAGSNPAPLKRTGGGGTGRRAVIVSVQLTLPKLRGEDRDTSTDR